MLPSYDTGDNNKVQHPPYTQGHRIVIEYTGLNMEQVRNLPIDEYLLYLHDGFLWKMNQTEEGREYLDNAYRMQQTNADLGRLRAFAEERKKR